MDVVLPVLLVLALLLLSAFFSGGELALMALDPIGLETRARAGSLAAKLQQRMRRRPQRFLSTILIGYNVANITLTAYATILAIHYLAPRNGIGEQRATLISTVAVTILITIFAELMPKTVAAIQTVKTARLVTYPMYVMDTLLTPLNWAIEKMVMPLIFLITGRRQGMEQLAFKRADVGTAIRLAHAGGELHSIDMAVAYEALHLSTRDLADVMTPRVDIVAVDEDCTVGAALQLMSDSGFTRLPLYGADLDDIRGVLLLKELVRVSLRSAAGGKDPEDRWAKLPARNYQRSVAHLPETKSVVDTLGYMQRERVLLVVVVDEHGGTAGIVTLEDILEELVGEIQDESDPSLSADVVRQTPEYSIVTGRARLDQVRELRGTDLAETESSTLGGLVMERLGRPAVVGDEINLNGVRVSVLKVLRTRIKLLKVEATGDGK
jgi:putative hemolysin